MIEMVLCNQLAGSPGEQCPNRGFLVAQSVKRPPAMQETQVRSLEEGMAAHTSILAWRIFMDRGAWRATVHGVEKTRTRLSD